MSGKSEYNNISGFDMSNAVFKIIFFLAVIALVGGCSGADPGEPTIRTGQFIDSPVSNLAFRTESQSGFTNSDGEFQYVLGETIIFSVGSLDFPPVSAVSTVTPQLMAGVAVEIVDNVVATNIARLLQSLDVDDDRTTIEIGDNAHSSSLEVAESDSLSFFASDDFDSQVAELVADLVSSDEARAHLRETFGLPEPINQLPTANAGANQSILLGETVTLNGAASDDPDGDNANLTYQWSLESPEGSSAELNDDTASSASFTPDEEGNYIASLVVNDGQGNSAPDTTTIQVTFEPPAEVPTIYYVTTEMTTDTTTSLENLSGSVSTTTPGTGTIDTETGIVSATGMVLDSQQLLAGVTPVSGIITVAIEVDSANNSGTQTRTACTNTSVAPLTCNGNVAVGEVLPITGLTSNTWQSGEITGDTITYNIDAASPSPLGGDLYNVGTVVVTLGEPVPQDSAE